MLGYTEAVLWGTTIGSFYNAIVVQPQTLQSHCLSPYCHTIGNAYFVVKILYVWTTEYWFVQFGWQQPTCKAQYTLEQERTVDHFQI